VAGIVNSEVKFPEADELVLKPKETCRMGTDQNAMRSGLTAALFFMTLSSATAIVMALLTFVTAH
jgi:hypothetical protein